MKASKFTKGWIPAFAGMTIGVRQTGIATLAMSIILLLVSTLMIFAVSKSSVNEQRIVAADLRSKDVYAAAIAGVEMGHKWLVDSSFILLDADSNSDGVLDTNDDAIVTLTTYGSDGFQNNVNVWLNALTPLSADPMLVQVVSTATLTGDTQVTKTVSTIFVVSSLLSNGGMYNAPPLVVEQCTTGINGTSEVTPTDDNYGMGTINGDVTDPNCLQEGQLTTNGSEKVQLDGADSAFEAVFGPNYTEQQLIADAAISSHIIYVDDTSNISQWQVDLGGPNGDGTYDTYILYFDSSADCPQLNAGVTVYGLVFYEAGSCSTPGWGGGNIYGNVVFSGNLTQLTGNGDLFYLDLDGGGYSTTTQTHDRTAAQVPGSWTDI